MDALERLSQALARNPKAKKLYETMPPPDQREYVRLIEEAKLSATKEQRTHDAIEHIMAWESRKLDNQYSGTPLAKKLGIKYGTNIVIHAPAGYEGLLKLDTSIVLLSRLQPGADFIQAFFTARRRLENDFEALKNNLRSSGQLWISWPKKTSKMETDLNDNVVREIGLMHGLVDVKIAAIDDDWSGLKFVYRVKDR